MLTKSVEVRCAEFLIPIAAEVVGAQGIDGNQNDRRGRVGFRLGANSKHGWAEDRDHPYDTKEQATQCSFGCARPKATATR